MEIILLSVLIGLTVTMLILGMTRLSSEKEVKVRMSALATPLGGVDTRRGRRPKSMDDSFTQRIVLPLAQNISDKIQAVIPVSGKSWIRQKLSQAGYNRPIHLRTFIGVHCLSTLIPTAFILFLLLVSRSVSTGTAILLFIFFSGMGFVFPLLWLIQESGRRQDSIRKALPDFLDLLIICLEAGLGIDAAISKIANIKSVQTSKFLRDELIHYTKDIGFGKPRKEALLDLAARTGVEDLNVIINALVQSFEMGTSVSQALRVQSDGLRVKRLHRAEAAANKISVKMVIPIYMFFFPGIFIIILGPMVLYTIKQIMSSMQANPLP